MDRKSLREYTHKSGNLLSIANSLYKQWVFRYTFLELEKDLQPRGDITTSTVFPEGKAVTAVVVAKSEGVIAGLEELKYFLVDADVNFRPSLRGVIDIEFLLRDGDFFRKGQNILKLKGDIRDLLIVERTMLNLLQRMSGVATYTGLFVEKVRDFDVMIAPTRKTLWGLLDKKAVLVGGGGTHRLNLSDAIIVKDTHLDVLGRNFDLVLENISSSRVDARFVEIEVENVPEAIEVSEKLSTYIRSKKIRSIGAVLLDNFTVPEVVDFMSIVREADFSDEVLFECSGGIDFENVLDYANTGVDIISLGCLTMNVKNSDLSMKILV
jgi:nicotinate-nucleotide pyrophosphorylase (carboxylating)